jgi:hypothetical protein
VQPVPLSIHLFSQLVFYPVCIGTKKYLITTETQQDYFYGKFCRVDLSSECHAGLDPASRNPIIPRFLLSQE